MTENTKIQWCDSTFNPWLGCTKVGPGCDNCYAEALAIRTGRDVWGPGKPRMETKGPWRDVLKWQAHADKFFAEHGRKRRVFVASMADVFDNEVDPAWRTRLWNTIEDCDQLNFLIVTKRIGNLAKMIPDTWANVGFPKNVGVMSTIVNQEEANRDIPKLLAAKSKFNIPWVGLSMEPLLGPVDLNDIKRPSPLGSMGALLCEPGQTDYLDWVIVGGESGAKHRNINFEADARGIILQCTSSCTPVFFKQMRAFRPTDDMIPADLMIREYQESLR